MLKKNVVHFRLRLKEEKDALLYRSMLIVLDDL